MTFEISNLTVSKSSSRNIDLDHKSAQFSEIQKYKKKYDSSAYSLNNSILPLTWILVRRYEEYKGYLGKLI